MLVEIGDRRLNQIDTVLGSCLNWQEAVAIDQHGELECGARATVSDVARAASQKRNFLQDALVYFLRGGPFELSKACANDVDFTFRDAVLPLLNDEGQYFSALALAKLFRARMSTRCGHRDGLPWGKQFSYPPCLKTYRYLTPLRRRTLAAARRNCFVVPPVNDRTPAAELAVSLLKSARDFVTFYDFALTPDQKGVLRDAILGRCYDAPALLDIWEIGRDRVYDLPMDMFWERAVDCVYIKNCVGYNEFVALTQVHAQRLNPECLQLARGKVQFLVEAERSCESEWQAVARNWWCHGFKRGIYSWKSAVKINKDIVADLQAVVDRIRGDDVYKKVEEAGTVRNFLHERVKEASAVQDLFISMTCAACEGASPQDIAQGLGRALEPSRSKRVLSLVYSFLFLVATTKGAPKLQDCWSRGD